MILKFLPARLLNDRGGAVAIEFALLGSFMITLLLGVLQVGMAMQKYNALRGITADVARYAVVQYQSGNEVSNHQLWSYAHGIATKSPYNLSGNDNRWGDGLDIEVTTPGTQRVDGATELRFWIRTEVPSVLDFIGLKSFFITQERPIFVIDE